MKIDIEIHKNVVYLDWVSFFTDFASSMVTTLLPLYVVYILNEGGGWRAAMFLRRGGDTLKEIMQ